MIIEKLIDLKVKLPTVREAGKDPETSAYFIKSLILLFIEGCEPFGENGVQLKTEKGVYKIGDCSYVPAMVDALKKYNRLAANRLTLDIVSGKLVTYKQFCK